MQLSPCNQSFWAHPAAIPPSWCWHWEQDGWTAHTRCGAPAEFFTTSHTGEHHFTDAEAAMSTSQVSLTYLEFIHGTSL